MQPEMSSPQAVDSVPAYWSIPAAALLARLDTRTTGLSSEAARARLARVGANTIRAGHDGSALAAFARQFRSPLVLILIFAAIVSGIVGEGSEAVIIGVIVLASCVLSFTQEYGASRAMQALTARIARKALVLRDGRETLLPVEEIVPGDIVRLSAGNLVPADGILLETRDFNVSEAALTGETFPVIKTAGICTPEARLSQRTNTAFTGTSVRSGTATMAVVKTGGATEFASIAATIVHVAPETDFARGIRRFGYLMTEIMLVIVILVFFANLLLHRPAVDSLLFSLALAVGLTPELLPAIISVTLARGARTMAANGVIVRRLDAIENLGSMDLLCTDKTGTLTEGVIHLDACLDVAGTDAPQVQLWAFLNATLQTGMANPLDEAIASGRDERDDIAAYAKVDEIPYDFIRKRLSVVVRRAGEREDLMICKGAVQTVVAACSSVLAEDGAPAPLDAAAAAKIDEKVQAWSGQGYRVLGLAVRRFARQDAYRREDEADLALAGFLLFFDPPKLGMTETLHALAARGIKVKIITGDNRYVAAHLAETVDLPHRRVLTGTEVSRLTKEALVRRVTQNDIFAEIDPNQKERIIAALRKHGHVVGYLGDGINDAPALHEADVGISVEGAVDVAREAADMILLQRDLGVLLRGIDDGRKTFANTMKYISITTSANFGNMISMALASLALPFLPLLAPQILLNNFLSDVPSLAIATDNVDADQVRTPRRWDIAFVRRFMVTFGLVSSFFDVMTFAFLLLVAGATASAFQTGWFVESLITELAIVLVVRTRAAFWRSHPSALLSWLTLAVAVFAVAIPYLPGANWFGFVVLPLPVVGGLIAITLAYLAASEAAKHWFFARERRRRRGRRRV
ncbi:magnesium-translocating P-type ATPase [Shinella yambaruensis]|uniref:magnesium-translocating P-type ATPase n=1 Tax=Shinella yambaruensis TaxID=415996 RepID=UPI003D7A4BAB